MAINICIDIGTHIVSVSDTRKPETYSDVFLILEEMKMISTKLKEKLIKMVKFRNLLGHLYMEIDNEKVYNIIQSNLEDFQQFKKEIVNNFKGKLNSSK